MLEQLKNINLLYVEDHLKTLENNKITFDLLFKNVYIATNYDKAIKLYKNKNIDLFIVDIELESKKDGFELANKIRTYDSNIPIVFLSGHDDSYYLLNAINSQMNGYLIKPLNIDKLFKLLNNFYRIKENKIKFNRYIYDFNRLELIDFNKNKIILGKKETQLLEVFLRNKNRVLTREELEYAIWNEPVDSQSLLKNLIANLRRKLTKEIIVNEAKIGWRINIV